MAGRYFEHFVPTSSSLSDDKVKRRTPHKDAFPKKDGLSKGRSYNVAYANRKRKMDYMPSSGANFKSLPAEISNSIMPNGVKQTTNRTGKWQQLPTAKSYGKRKPEHTDLNDSAALRHAHLPQHFDPSDFKTRTAMLQYSNQLDKVAFSRLQSARTELLLPEKPGDLTTEEGETTYKLTQSDLAKSVDIASAAKHFDLQLEKFGPYRIDFTRNGRNLLIGGRLGHVATFDWFTKDLHCEVNVMETVRDVHWLHNETVFAVAQKKWTYIYDNVGTELHCLKMMNDVLRLEFLPYHFLLVGSASNSFLHWLDVSVGKMVASYATRYGQIDVMCQNPTNGIIHSGCAKGVVSLWSPNLNEPLVKMLCHPCPVRAVCIDRTGRFMATAGAEKRIKVWDLRNYKELWGLKAAPVSHMAFSQQGLLACAMGTFVKVYKDVCQHAVDSPYMIHNCREVISDIQFCPYEDVLGVGHRAGYTSLIIPGAGEPNIDAFEANPFQSKNQRREAEVRSLLDKVQPEMITLDPAIITRINKEKENSALSEKIRFLYSKTSNAQLMERLNGKKEKRTKGLKAKRRQAVRAEKQRPVQGKGLHFPFPFLAQATYKEKQAREILKEKRRIRQELVDIGVLKEETRKQAVK